MLSPGSDMENTSFILSIWEKNSTKGEADFINLQYLSEFGGLPAKKMIS
jgi:hypothetical protein